MPIKKPDRKVVRKTKEDWLAEADEAIDALAETRAQIKALNNTATVLSAAAIEALDGAKVKTRTTRSGKTGTLVEPTTLVLDEEGLKRQLGAQVWNGMTVRVFDQKLLEAAIARKEVSEVTVSKHSTLKPGTRSVRVT